MTKSIARRTPDAAEKLVSIRDFMRAAYETRGLVMFSVGVVAGLVFSVLMLESVFSDPAVLQLCRQVLVTP